MPKRPILLRLLLQTLPSAGVRVDWESPIVFFLDFYSEEISMFFASLYLRFVFRTIFFAEEHGGLLLLPFPAPSFVLFGG